MFLNQSLKSYLKELTSESPTPGGGGTSAYVGALGAALGVMVASITLKKLDKDAGAYCNTPLLRQIIRTLKRLQQKMAAVVDSDPKVYEEVMACYKNLKSSKDPRKAKKAVQGALLKSYQMQEGLAKMILDTKNLLGEVGGFAKGSIRNDLIVAGALLDGAFLGACATARINVVYLTDPNTKQCFEQHLSDLEKKFKGLQFK